MAAELKKIKLQVPAGNVIEELLNFAAQIVKQGIPPGANIYELDRQIYDDIEGDAYRMSLALLMPPKPFTERFRIHHAEAFKIFSATNSAEDKINYCVNSLCDDFEVTFNAVVSRGRLTGLFKGEVKRKELPGSVVF